MSRENMRPYSFDKAEEEAAKMRELVGPEAPAEDYDAASTLLDEELAARARAEEPRPDAKELEASEQAVDQVGAELQEKGEALKADIVGSPRIRSGYVARLPRHSMPTEEKKKEMEAAGLKVCTRLVFNDGRQAAEVEVNDEIGEVVQKGYSLIRRKFRDRPAEREGHYQKLDRVLGQLAARFHPELFGLDSPDMRALASSDPDLYRLVRDTPCEVRFEIAVKKTELPPLAPRVVSPELPPIMPSEAQLEDEVDDLIGMENAGQIDFAKLERPDVDESRTGIIEQRTTIERIGAAQGTLGRPASELRILAGRMAAAHKSGEWSDALADDYIRLMDRLPQFIQHRLAYLDMLLRVEKGEMAMPKTMISVASGPHNAARAQQDMESWAKEIGVEPPKLLNVDLSHRMLTEGSRAFAERYGMPSPTADVRGSAFILPVRDAAFDLAECSSLDSFSEPEDVYLAVSEMVRVTRPGGTVRISVRRTLPDRFHEALQRDMGLDLLTPPHTEFVLPDSLYQQLRSQHGQAFADTMRRKARGAEYVLATRSARPAKVLEKEAAAEVFARAEEERRRGDGAGNFEMASLIHEKLRERARQMVAVGDYAINRKKPETPIIASPEAIVPPTPEAPPVTEIAPTAAPPIAVEVEPSPEERFMRDVLSKIESHDWDERSPERKAARQRIVREIVVSLKAETGRTVWSNKLGAALLKSEAFREQVKSSSGLPIAAIRMLPRTDRIHLLKTYAPRVAMELFYEGIIRSED